MTAGSDDIDLQCRTRIANEETIRPRDIGNDDEVLVRSRCECGDRSCKATVLTTSSQYEGVRAGGRCFLIVVDHENPQTSWVLSERERFAVVDIVECRARREARLGNPRRSRPT